MMIPTVFGIPIEFLIFGATLVGIAVFHHHTLRVAAIGMAAVTVYKLLFVGFREGAGLGGLSAHVVHEWVILANLFCLLVGFAVLSNHFQRSHVPDVLPRFLPDDWKGGFVLLVLVFVLSSFLDNIAAALIGAAVAQVVFRDRVHVGYLAAVVAASNAGGSGSVVGDTTTTMMWLAGISPMAVLPAFIGAGAALLVFGVPASIQQHRYQPIMKDERRGVHVQWRRVAVVAFVLVCAIIVNVAVNTSMGEAGERFPFLGVAVWVALLVAAPASPPDWAVARSAVRGSLFLLALVFSASLMPVEHLPVASWQTALGLGFVSSVFDNIPLTALAINQGGYDWGVLAYAVGFGGSMIWFGSSAGVAVASLFPQARSVVAWLRAGWYVAVAYVIGFLVLLAVWGWHPSPKREPAPATPSASLLAPAASLLASAAPAASLLAPAALPQIASR